MFIGHFGAGFAAKKISPQVSLGVLFLASQFIDLLWPLLVLAGAEHFRIVPGHTATVPLDFYDYPWSHSLVMVLVWAAAAGGLYFLFRKNRSGALVISLLVLSHWVLDFLVHIPDLPLLPGSDLKAGLGLWNSPAGSQLLEAGLFAGGFWLYLKATQPRNKTGTWSLISLAAFLAVIQVMNITSPPPPDELAVAVTGNLQWLFILWAFWVDRNRNPI